MTTFTGSVSSLTTGTAPTATELGYITGALQALSDAWSSYSPLWTAATTDPVIGNGTITGSYIQIGKLVLARFAITSGSTTTYGSGQYQISAPVALSSSGWTYGQAVIYDTSATTHYMGALFYDSSTTFQIKTHNNATYVNPTVPMTFANGDYLRGLAVYETV